MSTKAKSKRTRRCPLVEVQWSDAWANNRWRDGYPTTEKDVELRCSSVGYLLYEDEKRIVLTRSFNEGDQTDGVSAIPRQWCMKIRRIGSSKLVKWDPKDERWRWHQA